MLLVKRETVTMILNVNVDEVCRKQQPKAFFIPFTQPQKELLQF